MGYLHKRQIKEWVVTSHFLKKLDVYQEFRNNLYLSCLGNIPCSNLAKKKKSELRCNWRFMFESICCSIICNGQRLKITNVSNSEGLVAPKQIHWNWNKSNGKRRRENEVLPQLIIISFVPFFLVNLRFHFNLWGTVSRLVGSKQLLVGSMWVVSWVRFPKDRVWDRGLAVHGLWRGSSQKKGNEKAEWGTGRS